LIGQRTICDKYRSDDEGFTLIELLVVVVIIGVLIAIAIPLYLNYRKGAENKSAASDLRGAISVIEQCYGDSPTLTYPTPAFSATSTVTNIGACASVNESINLSSGTTFNYYPSTTSLPTNYTIVATHGTNGVYYCYTNAAGGSIKSESANVTAYTAACP
jgi:type IV pilus assembly protein PilA